MSTSLRRILRGTHDFFKLVQAIEDLQEKFHATRGHTHAGTLDEGPTVLVGGIADGSVTLAKMATLAANSIIGNNTAGVLTPLALTAAQVKALLAIAAADVSGLGTLATTYSAASLVLTSSLSVGANTADAGTLRLGNQAWIIGRNAANTGNINILQVNASDEIITDLARTFRSGNFAGAGYLALGGTPASAGAIRLTYQEWITARNAANSADVTLLRLDTGDVIHIGAITTMDAKLTLVAPGTGAASINLPIGAAPSSPVTGDLWHDSTQKCLELYANGIQQAIPGGLFVGTADATSADTNENSIVPTGVGTVTLPANFLVAGKTIRLTASGFLTAPGATTLRLRIKLGTTVILDTGAQAIAAATNQHWQIDALITCRTTGATGTVHAQGRFIFFTAATAPAGVEFGPNTAAVPVDTTAAQAVGLTALWSAATTESITTTNLTVEVLG